MADNTLKTLRNEVFYQVFVRNYKGGTFRAVTEDLDRIQSLGVNWIYLLPVHPTGEVHRKGSLGSPYAIKDYRAIDPLLGGKEEFKAFADAVHARGMKLMMDIVYNHTSPDSVLAKTHPEWFWRKPDGSMGNHVGDWWDVVDLDYSHPALWEYQIETLKIWAKYADGFRCDVAPMVPVPFWERARAEVEEVKPGVVWLAESGEPRFIAYLRKMGVCGASDGELYRAFDLCYDYDVYGLQKEVQLGELPLRDYLNGVNMQEGMYPDNACRLRFLENHDRPRAAALIPDDAKRRVWTAWLYYMKGAVMIYAGQECGCITHPTLFDPDPVDFHAGSDDSEYLRQLYEIRQDPLFADSSFHAQAAGINQSVILAVHEGRAGSKAEGRQAVGIVPLQAESCSVQVDLPDGTYSDVLNKTQVSVFEKTLRCSGKAMILSAECND